MNRIKFSLLWDKLKDPVFTTIRSWNPGKEDYYRSSIMQEFSVQKVHNPYSYTSVHVFCHAFLVEVKTLRPSEIDRSVLEKDVMLNGTPSPYWLAHIMKYEKVLLLTFSKVITNNSSLKEGKDEIL